MHTHQHQTKRSLRVLLLYVTLCVADELIHHEDRAEHDPSTISEQEVFMDVTEQLQVRIVLILFYAAIFIVGIIGNLLVIYVVLSRPHMRTVTNIFIANLAVSDISVCLWCVTFTPISGFIVSWIFGRFMCHFLPWLQMTCVYVSTYTSLAIALDRYKVIIHPFAAKTPVYAAVLGTLIIWGGAGALSLPMAVVHHVIELPGWTEVNLTNYTNYTNVTIETEESLLACEETWEAGRLFGIGSLCLQFIVPCTLIAFAYVRIFLSLSQKKTSIRKQDAVGELKRKRRMNKMLVAMVTIFVLCWLPMNVVSILMDVWSTFQHFSYIYLIFYITHVIAMSCTVYNPFLYGYMNENFRKEFRTIVPCLFETRRCCVRRRLINADNPQEMEPLKSAGELHAQKTPERAITNGAKIEDIAVT